MSLFPTTHWSLLAKATLDGQAEGLRALEELCRRYWEPVHQFIRARGVPDAEAQDLTQEFMVHLLERSAFERADRLRGRFRSFLLGALVRFLSDQADRHQALKRGGGVEHVRFDEAEPGDQANLGLATDSGAALFDREWATTILETALNRVHQEYEGIRRDEVIAVLKDFLPGSGTPPSYEEASHRLGLTVAAFKSEIHRLRRRFRALVREEVAQTVSAPHEIEAEMAHLQRVLMDKRSDFNGH